MNGKLLNIRTIFSIFVNLSVYIKRIQKVSFFFFFPVKNTPKLINQQFKNGLK